MTDWIHFNSVHEQKTKLSHTGGMRNRFKFLVLKVEGKKQRGRPRHGWDDNINLILRKSGVRMWT